MKSKIANANEKIAEEVTSGFSKIQDGVVGGFSKIEEAFINRYLKRDGESVAEAKERLQREARKHAEQNNRK